MCQAPLTPSLRGEVLPHFTDEIWPQLAQDHTSNKGLKKHWNPNGSVSRSRVLRG